MKNFFVPVVIVAVSFAGVTPASASVSDSITASKPVIDEKVAYGTTYKYRCYDTGGVYVGTFGSPQEGFLCSLIMVSNENHEIEVAEFDNRSTFCYYDGRGRPVWSVYNPYLGKYICPAK